LVSVNPAKTDTKGLHVAAKKSVRIIKKVRESSGVWRFVSLKKAGARYAWDDRAGNYFVDSWEGPKRRRELAGQTPSEALEAQRRKRNELAGDNELAGELMLGGKAEAKPTAETALTPLKDAIEMFLQHVRVRILGRRAHRLRSLLRLESIPH
jgi:hypothetical protein